MENMTKPAFRFSHMGINSENTEEAKETAAILAELFGLTTREIPASIFVDKEIEINKSMGFGKHGHIAFYTENIDDAMKYFQSKGINFNMDSAKRDENGNIQIIYMDREFNGFAIHLTNKK